MPNWCNNSLSVILKEENELAVEFIKSHLFKINEENKEEMTFTILMPEPENNDDWYQWRIDNWGTKWEPSEVSCRIENNSKIYIHFQTAWSPPDPVIRAFIESVTNNKFLSQYIEQIKLDYDEVGEGFWGTLTWDCETKQIVEQGGYIDCEWNFDNYERCDCDEHACPTCGDGGYSEDTPIEERYDCDCVNLPTIDEEGEALDTEELYG